MCDIRLRKKATFSTTIALAPTRDETFVGPIDYTVPTTPEEARAAILALGKRPARHEISVEAHDAPIGGVKAYLSDQAAEQEKRLVAWRNRDDP